MRVVVVATESNAIEDTVPQLGLLLGGRTSLLKRKSMATRRAEAKPSNLTPAMILLTPDGSRRGTASVRTNVSKIGFLSSRSKYLQQQCSHTL